MEHFISVSERTCHKDPENEKKIDVIFPPKKFEIWKTNYHTIFQIDQFCIYAKFQVPRIKTKKMNEGEHFGVTLCPQCIQVFKEL